MNSTVFTYKKSQFRVAVVRRDDNSSLKAFQAALKESGFDLDWMNAEPTITSWKDEFDSLEDMMEEKDLQFAALKAAEIDLTGMIAIVEQAVK